MAPDNETRARIAKIPLGMDSMVAKGEERERAQELPILWNS